MRVFVDSDACPIKDEALRVTARHGLAVTLIGNSGMRVNSSSQLVDALIRDQGVKV